MEGYVISGYRDELEEIKIEYGGLVNISSAV
jgi:hypothetical protein